LRGIGSRQQRNQFISGRFIDDACYLISEAYLLPGTNSDIANHPICRSTQLFSESLQGRGSRRVVESNQQVTYPDPIASGDLNRTNQSCICSADVDLVASSDYDGTSRVFVNFREDHEKKAHEEQRDRNPMRSSQPGWRGPKEITVLIPAPGLIL
jgi:hypothetical protein